MCLISCEIVPKRMTWHRLDCESQFLQEPNHIPGTGNCLNMRSLNAYLLRVSKHSAQPSSSVIFDRCSVSLAMFLAVYT